MFSAEDLREIYHELKRNKTTTTSYFTDASIKNSARIELQETLLQQTIEVAFKNIPYYRRLLDKLKLSAKDFKKIKDLQKLPPLTKQIVAENTQELFDPTVNIFAVRRTSGTTGPPLRIYVSKEEIETLRYLGEIMSIAGGLISNELALHICLRRLPLVVSQQAFTINRVWLQEDDPLGLHMTIMSLLERHPIIGKGYRISVLILPMPRLLRLITRKLKSVTIDPRSTGIRKILVAGGYITESLREEAKQEWNAEMWDTYSLTEGCGRASDCSNHYLKHFDFTMIPEVIDPHTKEPVGYDKEGILLLTTLHPFQQAMPLIRYWTGDIVVLTNEKCACGYSGVSIKKIIGRESQCIDMSDLVPKSFGTKWFSTNSLREVLEKYPKFSIAEYGVPRFRVDRIYHEAFIEIAISVEITYYLYQKTEGEKEKIKHVLIEEIEKMYPEWNNYFENEQIRLSLSFYPPMPTGYSVPVPYFHEH